jgi:hypothetical protein
MHVVVLAAAANSSWMAKLIFSLAMCILTLPVFGQDYALLLQHQLVGNSRKVERELTRHIRLLKNKQSRSRNNEEFIETVFHKTQSKFFRSYEAYAQLDQMFEKGAYNCLSGTTLYALIFESLGYEVTIFETRYHSFLIASSDDGPVLIESTDKINGVVKGVIEIQNRIDSYLNKESTQITPSSISPDRYIPIQKVTFMQLIGLHYLNKAVVNINIGRFKPAVEELSTAHILYPESERIEDLLDILTSQRDMSSLTAIVISTRDQKSKE